MTTPEIPIANPKFPVYLIIWYPFNLLKIKIYCHWYDCIDFYYLLLNWLNQVLCYVNGLTLKLVLVTSKSWVVTLDHDVKILSDRCHVLVLLACDWSLGVTWPKTRPLIGQLPCVRATLGGLTLTGDHMVAQYIYCVALSQLNKHVQLLELAIPLLEIAKKKLTSKIIKVNNVKNGYLNWGDLV